LLLNYRGCRLLSIRRKGSLKCRLSREGGGKGEASRLQAGQWASGREGDKESRASEQSYREVRESESSGWSGRVERILKHKKKKAQPNKFEKNPSSLPVHGPVYSNLRLNRIPKRTKYGIEDQTGFTWSGPVRFLTAQRTLRGVVMLGSLFELS